MQREVAKYQEQLPRVWAEINRGQAENDAQKTRLEVANKLIEQLVEALKGVMPFTINGSVECRGDKCRERWCLSCNVEEDVNTAVAEACVSFDAVKEALAAAKSFRGGGV